MLLEIFLFSNQRWLNDVIKNELRKWINFLSNKYKDLVDCCVEDTGTMGFNRIRELSNPNRINLFTVCGNFNESLGMEIIGVLLNKLWNGTNNIQHIKRRLFYSLRWYKHVHKINTKLVVSKTSHFLIGFHVVHIHSIHIVEFFI